MGRISAHLGVIFSATLVFCLSAPAVWFNNNSIPGKALYGYTASIPTKPTAFLEAFFNKSLQRWIEKNFEVEMGFRALLLRSFNELNFALFSEAPRLKLIATKDHGLYSSMSLENLHYEIINKSALEAKYRVEAKRLRQVQDTLASHGKHFVVLIGASKPYVYPAGLGNRYLSEGNDNIFEKAASFGTALKAEEVNVIDAGPDLRKLASTTGLKTHADSGVHWNYFAGCFIASQLLVHIRQSKPETPGLDCGKAKSHAPHAIDLDGYLLLNILSDGGLLKPTIYPDIIPVKGEKWRPSIVFIGDSFADQVRDALKQGNTYARMVMSSYFRTRDTDDRIANTNSTEGIDVSESIIRSELMSDIASSDVVILEMVDYNVNRWGYDFPDYFLTAGRRGAIQISSTDGGHGRESDGRNWWHWVDGKISFKFKTLFASTDASRTRIQFEYGVRGTHPLTLKILTRNGVFHQKILPKLNASLAAFDESVDLPPAEILELGIETDENATPLGSTDPRLAAWIIRNLSVTPIFN
jgi:hypothetical protein